MNKTIKKLERNRFSILTDDLSVCYVCGKPKDDLHEIFEGKNRVRSMQDGMVLPVCRSCHNKLHSNREMALVFKRIAQKKYLDSHSTEQFVKRFGRNYLI